MTAALDLDFIEKVAGEGRDTLESRIRALCRELRTMRAAAKEREDTLAKHQAASTALRTEVRERRAFDAIAGTPTGAFVAMVLHEGDLARAKYPVTESLPYMLCVLAKETGEAARAFAHKEGFVRMIEELAQTAAVCIRIAVDCAHECPTKEPKP